MRQFMRDILTEDDNRTWCVARLSLVLGLLSFIMLATIHVWHNASFNPAEYGLGLGSLFGGAGILIGGKAVTQKDVSKLD